MSKLQHSLLLTADVMFSNVAMAQGNAPDAAVSSSDQTRLAAAKPWTPQAFQNGTKEFECVIIGDRSGGANVVKTLSSPWTGSTRCDRSLSSMPAT